MKLTKCPYCGRRIPYFSAIIHKDEGEYTCKRCKRESKIAIIKPRLYFLFIVAVILAVLMLIVFMGFTDRTNILWIFLVALPFAVFYLLSPMLIKLIPLKKYKKVNIKQRATKRNLSDNYGFDNEANIYEGPKKSFSANQRVSDFKKPIDRDVFNKIKQERNKTKEQTENPEQYFSEELTLRESQRETNGYFDSETERQNKRMY